MLINRFNEVSFEYMQTSIWSLGICVSTLGLELPEDHKFKILQALSEQKEIPEACIANIPSLVFSLTCFFHLDHNELVTDVVEMFSNSYLD